MRSFAERLHALIIEPIEINDRSVFVGASVGIAISTEDGTDMDSLLQKSDLAMYRAKQEPHGNIAFYNADKDEQSKDRLLLVAGLRRALEAEQFELAFQLQNDVSSLDPIGFEALLRWNHPTRGRVSPGIFIPIAEETGLIREIGLWVLRTACSEAAGWSEPFSIAVNVSPLQLAQPSFVENLLDALMDTQLSPERLELEVTEATIIDDMENVLKVMHKIKGMGVRIAMDDFGTGYSSLATLQAFPFDKIKIDRSFITDIHKDHQRAAIVRATLLLGDALKIPVLAEGVEYEDELQFLRDEKCQFVQGFFFGTPMSSTQIQNTVSPCQKTSASGGQ